MVMSSSSRQRWQAVILSGALMLPLTADAHTGIAAASGWVHGLSHPFSGLDHLCAMIAVGLWAAQMGGQAVWRMPLAFVSVMALGGLLGTAGFPLPFIEGAIVSSVLVLGVLIAAAVRLPLRAGMALVGLFAVFHGYAHGAEMPKDVIGLSYALGFLLATAALHLTGIGIARWVRHVPGALRYAGGTIAACGAFLWLAA